MQIELIGCTSAGKSTLTRQMTERGRQQAIQVCNSYDFVLQHYRLGWIKPHSLRMLLLNSLALGRCIRAARRHWALLRFIFSILHTLPATVKVGERLKIARITLRNLGIHDIIARANQHDMIVLADEGTIQVVHYLFVHLRSAPALDQLAAYLQQTPLPDLVLYYRQPAELLQARTLQRGHKRIVEHTTANVERFIDHALAVFEHVIAEPVVQQRTLIVDGCTHQVEQSAVGSRSHYSEQEQALAHLVTTLIQAEAEQPLLVYDNSPVGGAVHPSATITRMN